jgi:PAS domain S-box-containing protein
MNGNFYTSPPTPDEVRQRLAMHQNMALAGGDSLDDIVRQNSREFQRRRSVPHLYTDSLAPQNLDRRMSMMDFDPTGDSLEGYSFGFPNNAALAGTCTSGPFSQPGLLAMPGPTGFGTLPPVTASMDFSGLDMGSMGTDPASMGLFSQPDLQNQYPSATLNAVNRDFNMDMGVESGAMNAPSVNPMAGFAVGGSSGMMGAGEVFDSTTGPRDTQNLPPNTGMSQFQTNLPLPEPPREPSSVPVSFHSPASAAASRAMSQSTGGRSSAAAGGTPTSTAHTPTGPPLPTGLGSRDPKKDIYSKSGFDMLRALFYVATRKNPTVEIGAVDLSCAFVVCDMTLNDCPIIYVSDNFQNLTGYNRHEIIGKNCRFLQSPDSKVEAGTKREFVANDAVFKLKKAVAERTEIQQSLINYRKGGKPFLNLLTMIPIPWDTDEYRYCIGFQIDLVECPEAISGQESGGAMQVNYRHSDIGQYFWTLPNSHWEPESGQTLTVDEVSSLIQQHNPANPPSEYHKQTFDKMLLENADDVIHVLSPKGLFLYLSPACRRTLEYDPADLVGTSLSSICHPSDIVPVTREHQDAAPHGGAAAAAQEPINIAFRIRRKHSGYMWFESHGALLCEQQRGRKYIMLVGRPRPVFSLRRRVVEEASALFAGGGGGGGGVMGDGEIWSKVSTAGMFLSVSSGVKALLDLAPRELEGTSMQELMRRETRAEFGRTIEKARRGVVVGLRHEVLHKRGQLVPAQTVFYPGDGGGPKGKPSFLIAQTRLVKGAGRVIAQGKAGGGGGSVVVGVGGEDVVMGKNNNSNNNPPLAAQALSMPTVAYSDSATDESGEEDDIFAELKTTRCTSWQYELRQMEKMNRLLAEELTQLMASRKKRKRRKPSGIGMGGGGGSGSGVVRDCANCHKRDTPEWRRGPSGNRDLCNSCGLRWAKQVFSPFLFVVVFVVFLAFISRFRFTTFLFILTLSFLHSPFPLPSPLSKPCLLTRPKQTGKVSPRNTSRSSSDASASKRTSASSASTNSPAEASPLRRELSADAASVGSATAGMERSCLGGLGEGVLLGSGIGGIGMEMGSIREE